MRALVLTALAGALVIGGAVAARSTDSFAAADAGLKDVDLFNVCDAASTFAARGELALEAAERNAADSAYLTYGAGAEKTTVQCVVDGDQVVWHVAEAEGPSGLLPAAEQAAHVLSFRVTDAGVVIAPAA